MKKFLECAGEVGETFEDHLVGFLRAGYGASLSKMEYETWCYRRGKVKNEAKFSHLDKLRHRYVVMAKSLEHAQLVQKKGGQLRLTQKGVFRLRELRKITSTHLRIPIYKLSPGHKVVIITFDIPEKMRQKRDWLRATLKNLGMRFIQQSVWVGKGVLPQQFLEDLKNKKLSEYVEIFEVTKKGSLEAILTEDP